MARQGLILSLLILTVLASGCTGGGGGGQNLDQYGDQAIVVHDLQVTPSEIFAGSNTRVRMSLSNVGEITADLKVAENEETPRSENKGSQIMTNHCPDIFDVEEFSASSTNSSRTQASYNLAPGHKVQLNWKLAQDSADVPLNGYNCNLRFEVPFEYSVEAFRQIQVNANTGVESQSQLFAKSSKGPMKLELEAIGSSAPQRAPTFLQDDSAEILVQLTNKKPEESSYIGTVELGPPELDARGINFSKVDTDDGSERVCPHPDDLPESGQLTIYQGKSEVFRCGLDWSDHDFTAIPSLKGEVYAKANYTFVKNAGNRQVNVRYREN